MNTPISPVAHPLADAITWADPARRALFEGWLQSLSAQAHDITLDTASVRLASADASFRRYLRIDSADAQRSFIIMDAPPQHEDCRAFVHVQRLMHAAGLRVPAIHAWDEAAGFMLLDDLGGTTLIELLDPAQPDRAQPWYAQAAALLLPWQQATQRGVLPEYDAALLARELQLFPDWYIAQHKKITLNADQKNILQKTFELIIQNNLQAPQVFVHRDFMTRNLMAPPVGENLSLGVLDFQDAVLGPVTYDIASLTRDAFISWEEDFVIDIVVRYWEKARAAGIVGEKSASGWGADFGEFWRAVEWMGLQRHLKVAGIFARLTLRDGKPKYLADAPRFIHYIRHTCSRYRELSPLLRLVDTLENIQPEYGYAYGRV